MGITRKIIISVSLIMSVLFLSSCSYVTSIDRLLSPPKLTELQAELLDALEQGLQTDVGNVILKYPNYGEGDEINRKAFILADIDGDGQDETIVFHQSKESAGAEIIMNILDNIDGKWVWMCDTEQKINTEYSRSEILNVIFEDLNGDGKNEIITEWSLSTSTNRCFIIMDYIVNDDGGSLIISDAAEHSRLVVCDLDEDGSKEIFTAAINFVEKTSSARLYKMNKSGDIYVAMETAMDASATSYAPLICSRLYGTEKPAVYADGYKSNNEMITEVIFCREQNNSKELFNPFYIQPASILNNEGEATVSGMVTATMRNSALLTEDINGDGYPDIPFCEPLPPISAQSDEKTGGPAEYSAETVYRTLYGSYTGDEFVYTVDSMGRFLSKG